ncbi:MAG: tetratricopeptide repeat protein, partial [Trebonia sp.]
RSTAARRAGEGDGRHVRAGRGAGDVLNERFGLDLGTTDEILVYQGVAVMVADNQLQQVGLSNDEARFGQVADERLDEIVAENAERNTAFMKLYFDNDEFRTAVKEAARKRAYKIITDPAREEALARLRAEMERETAPGSLPELRMRHTLAAALLMAGRCTRAASLFEQAGAAYRQYLGATDPWALDCAYQAGHAYAQAGKPDKALPQLRYYVANSAALGPTDAEELAKVMESRFVTAQLLATSGDLEGTLAELHAVRPLLAAAYGPESAQVRNLDKQAARLRSG